MKVVRDLLGGAKPTTIELPYNGDEAADSVTTRYKGSLAKVMDDADDDNGVFVTFAGITTAMLNVCGILEEEQGKTGNYLFNDASYGFAYRKITPVFPSTVVEAEYSRTDAAGTANTDTGATATASSTTFTCGSITTSDAMIGGWIFFLTGSNAGYLHYVTDNDSGGNTMTFATAVVNAVASGDTFLVIRPPMTNIVDFDATYTGLKSEVTESSCIDVVNGLSTWIQSPGHRKVKLARDSHDGLYIGGTPLFFHQFTLPGSGTYENFWISGRN